MKEKLNSRGVSMTLLCCCTDGISSMRGTVHCHKFFKRTDKHGGNAEISEQVNKGSAI